MSLFHFWASQPSVPRMQPCPPSNLNSIALRHVTEATMTSGVRTPQRQMMAATRTGEFRPQNPNLHLSRASRKTACPMNACVALARELDIRPGEPLPQYPCPLCLCPTKHIDCEALTAILSTELQLNRYPSRYEAFIAYSDIYLTFRTLDSNLSLNRTLCSQRVRRRCLRRRRSLRPPMI